MRHARARSKRGAAHGAAAHAEFAATTIRLSHATSALGRAGRRDRSRRAHRRRPTGAPILATDGMTARRRRARIWARPPRARDAVTRSASSTRRRTVDYAERHDRDGSCSTSARARFLKQQFDEAPTRLRGRRAEGREPYGRRIASRGEGELASAAATQRERDGHAGESLAPTTRIEVTIYAAEASIELPWLALTAEAATQKRTDTAGRADDRSGLATRRRAHAVMGPRATQKALAGGGDRQRRGACRSAPRRRRRSCRRHTAGQKIMQRRRPCATSIGTRLLVSYRTRAGEAQEPF